MIKTAIRKGRQITADPVLRCWIVGRLLGRWPGELAFRANYPPYLDGMLPLIPEAPQTDLRGCDLASPTTAIELVLPGLRLKLNPGDERDVFSRSFDDVETFLGLHRFAWINASNEKMDPAWVSALWIAWLEDHETPDHSWAWHPYTAAERVANILIFASHQGLPGPRDITLRILAAHGPAIAGRLEYFGEHHTSNHLANNGRGLYLLGLALGLPQCVEIGACILVEEAARIFLPSGILREGSTHYHLLLAHNYAECAAAATTAGRPEAKKLEEIAKRALGVLSQLKLNGGLPLVGDISPDCPPARLLELLENEEVPFGASPENLLEDGWLRADFGPWSGLWHAAPGGWSNMPGHGHQDVGGFELHFRDQPVFIDPGRGHYGETDASAVYRSGSVHNTLLVDRADPYPPNKPYYDEKFRRYIGGPVPELKRSCDSVSLTHYGFKRLKGGGSVSRDFSFSDNSVVVRDRVEGQGSHRISRSLCTPLDFSEEATGLVLKGKNVSFRLSGDETHFCVTAGKCWKAYGESVPINFITIETRASLPWSAFLKLEIL